MRLLGRAQSNATRATRRGQRADEDSPPAADQAKPENLKIALSGAGTARSRRQAGKPQQS